MQETDLNTNQNQVVNWQEQEIPKELLSTIPIESVERYQFLPFATDQDSVSVAVVDENDISTQNALRFFSGKVQKQLKTFPISEEEFSFLFKKFKNPEVEIGRVLNDLEQVTREEKTQEAVKPEKRQNNVSVLQEAPVSKMVEVILKNAIDGGASDIHIEPMDGKVRVRYRVDGILYNSIMLPSKVGPAIVSRVKILSNLKIDEKRKPQDGRFRISDLGKTIDFRVSTFPVTYGEKVVMRILDKDSGLVKLESLGFIGKDLEIIQRIIEEPFGIILVTGPTGSGKSTSLYSVLNILNKEGINIVTLEDPIEYVLEGINQSQVKPEIDYTFSSGLRSILRQDPDVVMVGEIRDSETAELAIHAALTGHLVLSTLHTNSAVGAVPRLVDMGIQPFLISSSLKLIIGQRLVRRICPECKEKKQDIPAGVSEIIKNELSKLSDEYLQSLGINKYEPVSLYYGKGCSHCHNNGMKGRVGIYEVLEISDTLTKLIGNGVQDRDIHNAAIKNGYTTMKQDGIIKALLGVTTFEEVERVTEDDNEEEVLPIKE